MPQLAVDIQDEDFQTLVHILYVTGYQISLSAANQRSGIAYVVRHSAPTREQIDREVARGLVVL